MQIRRFTRRVTVLMPLVLAACASEPEQTFEPLRYNYLPAIELKVAAIEVQSRFIPSGVAPDVSSKDPMPPIEALRAMAVDRLQSFGVQNKAIFAIQDASLTRENDTIMGSMSVSLTIQGDDGGTLGFAEARVQSRHTGRIHDLRAELYDFTKAMMNDMNVEFEYQVRHNLKDYITSAVAPDTPVEQAPLAEPPAQ